MTLNRATFSFETFEVDVILLYQKLRQLIPDEWYSTTADKLTGIFVHTPYLEEHAEDGYLLITTPRCEEIEDKIYDILREIKPEWKHGFYIDYVDVFYLWHYANS